MRILFKWRLTLLLNILWTIIAYVEPLEIKDTSNQDIFEIVMKTACSPDGQCWEWSLYPIPEKYDVIISEPESDTSRSRRQIANPSEFALKSSKNNALEEIGREIQPALSSKQQIIKIAKRNRFRSGNWDMSMPFTVLYMNFYRPRSKSNRTVMTSTSPLKISSTTAAPVPFLKHYTKTRISRKNQPIIKSKKYFRYFILPQLFTYDWNSFGK